MGHLLQFTIAVGLMVVTITPNALGITDDSENIDIESAKTQKNTSGFRWAPALDLGIRLGVGLQEDSLNNREFSSGFIVGPEMAFNPIKFRNHQLSLSTGFLHFTNSVKKGTDSVWMTTTYNRMDICLGGIFNWGGFVLNSKIGSGLMFISTSTHYLSDTRKHSGVDPGFLLGLGTGIDIGKLAFKLNRKIVLSVQSDWLRRGNRDEFTIFGVLSAELWRIP